MIKSKIKMEESQLSQSTVGLPLRPGYVSLEKEKSAQRMSSHGQDPVWWLKELDPGEGGAVVETKGSEDQSLTSPANKPNNQTNK